MSTQKKDQYRETVPHKSHFVPVSVHTTKIEIPTETDGAAALPEKNFQHFIFIGIQNWNFSMWRKEKQSFLLKIMHFF